MDHADAYQRVYRRICTLLEGQDEDVEAPTCPGWTVKDVVAHLAGFFTTFRSGDPRKPSLRDGGTGSLRNDRIVLCRSATPSGPSSRGSR
ncbi:MAG: maleylpyruvate isomerase N-terminal domain-containing protein [Actinomycetota bacterium]